jgi:hypothetical protein
MDDLVLCRACERHLRRDETRCPFCDAPLSSGTRATDPRVAPPGLSRARLYAFHAAVATGVAASSCGSNPTPTAAADAAVDADTDASAGADAGEAGNAAADASGAGNTTEDATVDANDAADANSRDWGPIPLPYGCVFPGDCDGVKV